MSDEKKKDEPPAKYRPIENGGTYRGVDPENPIGFTRDPANRKKHKPRNQVTDGVDTDPFEY